MRIGIGEDWVEIEDENGNVTVERFKSMDELNAIIKKYEDPAIESKVTMVRNPFYRWIQWIKKIFGESLSAKASRR